MRLKTVLEIDFSELFKKIGLEKKLAKKNFKLLKIIKSLDVERVKESLSLIAKEAGYSIIKCNTTNKFFICEVEPISDKEVVEKINISSVSFEDFFNFCIKEQIISVKLSNILPLVCRGLQSKQNKSKKVLLTEVLLSIKNNKPRNYGKVSQDELKAIFNLDYLKAYFEIPKDFFIPFSIQKF
ncbi:MAG: hypothetical protein QG630_311 [Patescibacteria group bacterium]|nr:hypothetical protein [Patescibacteria group bacterium]